MKNNSVEKKGRGRKRKEEEEKKKVSRNRKSSSQKVRIGRIMIEERVKGERESKKAEKKVGNPSGKHVPFFPKKCVDSQPSGFDPR